MAERYSAVLAMPLFNSTIKHREIFMSEKLKKYELTLVLDKYTTMRDLTKIKRAVQKYTIKEIKREGWVTDDVRPLAYKMDCHTEAGYVYCDLWLDEANAEKLENKLEKTNHVIRYLLVQTALANVNKQALLSDVTAVVNKYADGNDSEYHVQFNGDGRVYNELKYSIKDQKYVMMIGEDNE